MKFIQLNAFGSAHKVCSVEQEDAPGLPGPDEVTVRMLACPINPAELLIFAGRYASKPPLPYRPGIEGCGEITAAGANVTSVSVGDRVISFGRNNWAESLNLPAKQVIKVPAHADPLQLGMLKVNPATAWLMLTEYVDLLPGDWLIQNAANSGVGHAIIQLAKANGWRTINVVRRPWLVDPLKTIGADVVVLDGDDLGERVAAEVGDGRVRLGIDAIAGSSTQRLADCLADGSPILNYGFLSGNPCELAPEHTVFRDITLRGFWLSRVMGEMGVDDLTDLYATLGMRVADGTISAPVEATYGLDDIDVALEHALREGRRGKILLTPNGPVS